MSLAQRVRKIEKRQQTTDRRFVEIRPGEPTPSAILPSDIVFREVRDKYPVKNATREVVRI